MKYRHILMYCESISLVHITKLLKIATIIRQHAPDTMITFVSGFDKAPWIEAHGFEVHPVKVIDPSVLYNRLSEIKPVYNYDILRNYLEEDLKVLRLLRPDLVIYDTRLTIPLAAQITGTPIVSVTPILWTSGYDKTGMVPFELLEEIPIPTDLISIFFNSSLWKMFEKRLILESSEILKRLSAELGLKAYSGLHHYTAEGIASIVPDLPALVSVDGPHSSRLHFVGPLLWEFPEELTEELRGLKKDRPTVYFSLGTSAVALKSMIALMEELLQRNYRIIVQRAGRFFPNAPHHKNLFICAHLPGLDFLSQMDLVISQGGNNTIYQALSAGVPILGIPSFSEQQWYMDQVTRVGCGKSIPPNRLDNVKEVASTIYGIVENNYYRDNAQLFRSAIQSFPTEEKVLIALNIDNEEPVAEKVVPYNISWNSVWKSDKITYVLD